MGIKGIREATIWLKLTDSRRPVQNSMVGARELLVSLFFYRKKTVGEIVVVIVDTQKIDQCS